MHPPTSVPHDPHFNSPPTPHQCGASTCSPLGNDERRLLGQHLLQQRLQIRILLNPRAPSEWNKSAVERNPQMVTDRTAATQGRRLASSAMFWRIFRCTEALTWFCPVTSSEVNLGARAQATSVPPHPHMHEPDGVQTMIEVSE